MSVTYSHGGPTRREVIRVAGAGLIYVLLAPFARLAEAAKKAKSKLFWVYKIPKKPFRGNFGRNHHVGVDCLLHLMGAKNLKFYRSKRTDLLSGPKGMIAADDIVLVKVNGQWKYRGCTNSDVIRGLIQSVLEHPDGFTGEVVIVENGQGVGSLRGIAREGSYLDASVQANANNRLHTFEYLVDTVFNEPRVSSYLWDPIRWRFLDSSEHEVDGYRRIDNVSYPCFTTAAGNRVELREGIWHGSGYSQNLKLINVPVLKHHDQGGSEITASLKHMYGVLSMEDVRYDFRHYDGLGETCGKMFALVRAPVLNIIDAIWVSQESVWGIAATRVNQLVASQDPIALDYWAAKYILYPIDQDERHHPNFPGIAVWLNDARDIINRRRALWQPKQGLRVKKANINEKQMKLASYSAKDFLKDQQVAA